MEHLTDKEITHLLTGDTAVFRCIEMKTKYLLENSQFQTQNYSQTDLCIAEKNAFVFIF